MRISIRFQILAFVVALLLGAIGSYLLLATRLIESDNLAYVYDVTGALAHTKSEEVRANVTSLVDKLLLRADRSAADERGPALPESVFDIDPDLLAVDLWLRSEDGWRRADRRESEERIERLGITSKDLREARGDPPVAFDAVRADGVVIRNSSLAPDTALLTVAAVSADGERVVVADVSPARLLRLFARSDLYATYLVNTRGDILLHSDAHKVAQRANTAQLPIVDAAFRSQVRSGVREFTAPAGQMLGAFAYTLGQMSVIAEVPRSEAMRGARRLTQKTAMFAVAVVLLTLLASIYFSHRIVAPLRQVEQAAATIAAGSFGVQIPVRARNEIGSVAAAFNTMSARLADRETRYMGMMGTLAGGVAHEINNPLTYIISNAQFAADTIEGISQQTASAGGGDAGEARLDDVVEALRDLKEGARRVQTIVTDLKSFAGGNARQAGEVDVRALLTQSLSMADAQLKYRADVVREFGEVRPVIATAGHLGQVFLNLIVNAAQALPPERGVIRIVTRMEGADQVLVEIIDSGVGIPTEVLQRIFDPFFSTRPVGKGSGLGLAISHSLITAAGGRITVESEVGRGSCFRVYLPAAPGTKVVAPTPHPATVPAAPPVALRVLIVDDDAMVGRALRHVLGAAEVVAANGGHEAMELLASDDRFDLVFCDLMMPGMTGMDVYEAVRAERPELVKRFVFMSGGAFTPEARSFVDSIGGRLLDKPFDEQRLRALVEERLPVAPVEPRHDVAADTTA